MRSGTPVEALQEVATRRSYPGGSAAVTWGTVLLWLIPAITYYAYLICLNLGDYLKGPYQGSILFSPVVYGLTFNSMLLHLLHGAFDIDPATIGPEGFA